MKSKVKFLALFALLPLLSGCDDLVGTNPGSEDDSITVTPSTVTIARGETQQFTANESYGVTWSLEGATGSSNISNGGLLTVGADETATTLTVRAKKSHYKDGTARVTIASPGQTPSGLKVNKPSPNSIQLSWSLMSGVTQYTVQRSTNGNIFGTIGTTSGVSYADTNVNAGSYYYYRISVNGVNSNVIFVFAADYFNMPSFVQKKLIPITNDVKQYYRFAVQSGKDYTIEWQNGNNQNTNWGSYDRDGVKVSAWQNNGTVVFSDAVNGYTNPRVITATDSGFITIEVKASGISGNYDYQIYCYGIDGVEDSGTVALPPYKVSSFRVSVPSQNAINLSWDSVSDGVKYNVYRSNTQTGTLGKIGETSGTTYTDNQVSSSVSYWYTIAAVNTDGKEGSRFQGAFGFAVSHYNLSNYTNAPLFAITNNVKQYYRLAVTAGQSFTLEWQNGNNQNTNWGSYDRDGIKVSAWQNNGTVIFTDAVNGYTNPRVITATDSGFITIEVKASGISDNYDYQIYYY